MFNKLKIAALVVVTVVGMVLYKQNFDAKAAAEKRRKSAEDEDERLRWN